MSEPSLMDRLKTAKAAADHISASARPPEQPAKVMLAKLVTGVVLKEIAESQSDNPMAEKIRSSPEARRAIIDKVGKMVAGEEGLAKPLPTPPRDPVASSKAKS